MCITPNNGIPFNLFGYSAKKKVNQEAFKKLLNKSENLIEEKMRSQSPYLHGKRNPNFIHPSYETHFEIGYKNANVGDLERNRFKKLQDLKEEEIHYLTTINKNEIEELPDPRAFHENLNNRRKEAILAKIRNREQLSNIAAKILNKDSKSDKQKLIESNEKNEYFINKPHINPLLERAKERCRLNDLFVIKNQKFMNNKNDEKEKYFKNYIYHFKPPEHKEFVNDKVEPKIHYLKAMEEQIFVKKQNLEAEKKLESRIISEYNDNLTKQMEEDERIRQNKIFKIKKEFEEGNRILIQKKAEKKEYEKQKKKAEELEKIAKVKEEAKQVMMFAKDKKNKERRELSDSIQKHLEAKRMKELKELHLMRLRANKSAITSEGLNLSFV